MALGFTVLLFLGYRLVGKHFETFFQPFSDSTPAVRLRDGRDYEPASPYVLFGHHFASIAGAGPIVGPIVAMMGLDGGKGWGWGWVMLWLLLGGIFIGSLHDYLALMVSLRSDGCSIADVARRYISTSFGGLLLGFVLLALLLVQSAFTALTAKTFVNSPQIVLPTLGLIGLAILYGLAEHKLNLPSPLLSLTAWTILTVLLILGYMIPIELNFEVWVIILAIYAYIASVLPVWLLLRPRDWLSTGLLIAGLVAGYISLSFLKIPPKLFDMDTLFAGGNPWPTMFILVACGAVSGFHALVASGTTSKQVKSERHALLIAYGGMLTETALAGLVVMLITATLSKLEGTPVNVFSSAFSIALSNLGISPELGYSMGSLMLNAFMLTTLDTATRLNRYILEEISVALTGKKLNFWISTAIIVGIALGLTLTNSWCSIWNVFGASNQLLASLVLMVAILSLHIRSGWSFKKLALPIVGASFMIITSIAELVRLIVTSEKFLVKLASGLLILLAISAIVTAISTLRSASDKSGQVSDSTS